MELMRYQEPLLGGFRAALIVSEGRKWMKLAVIDKGMLHTIRRPMSEKEFLTPMELNRKSKASLRRLARKKGTSRMVRAAVKEI
jgi:hypothetical protein